MYKLNFINKDGTLTGVRRVNNELKVLKWFGKSVLKKTNCFPNFVIGKYDLNDELVSLRFYNKQGILKHLSLNQTTGKWTKKVFIQSEIM